MSTPETTPVRPAHRFDEVRLAAYLNEQLGGIGATLTVRQYRAGQSNPTFLIETATRRLVLRKKPPGTLLPGAHLIEREYRVLAALKDSAVPVPDVLLLCEDPTIIGTSFYVMAHVEGRVIQDPALPGFTPAERAAAYRSMAETLAALHAIDWRAVGLADFGKPSGYLSRQIALWTRQYEATKHATLPAMARLIKELPARLPLGDETTIAHGDFRFGNLILDARTPRVIAVLDWELATLGHPLSDLAYNCLPYHVPLDAPVSPGLVGRDLRALGIPSEADHLARYRAVSGRGTIGDWPFYLAFALFRLAAISQGVYDRALKGNAASDDAPRYGAVVPMLAGIACAELDQAPSIIRP